jgi:ankyrin repeat protein
VVLRSPLCAFPSLNLTELLLELGADPNQVDDHGNTPLHIAAAHRSLFQASLVTTLLQKGAHYDFVNKAGETFMETFEKSKNALNAAGANPYNPNPNPVDGDGDNQQVQPGQDDDGVGSGAQNVLSNVKPLHYVNLQCLAACAVNRFKIPISREVLPQSLIDMVESHGE